MNIFINAKTEELANSIASALDDFGAELRCCWDDQTAESEDMSRYDVVIISTPLRSEFGLNYIAQTAKRTSGCIVVLAKTDIAADVQNRIRFTGAFVLPRPFSKSALQQTIRVAQLAKENMTRLEEEKSQLSKQLDDVKAIDRAKCCLIQYLNLTEKQAHRHIQKLAMDSRRPQREIADDILRTYSGLTNI
ncbi:MAG: ANTAR domain-containing protein [Oscillospiraceae bacterium]